MAFTIPQRQDLADALTFAFNWQTLSQAFREHLETRLDVVTSESGFGVVVETVLVWAEQNGWERPLVRMMHETRPDQPKVLAFMDRHREFPARLLPDERERLRAGLFGPVKTVGDLRALLLSGVVSQPPGFLQGTTDESSADAYLRTIVRWADHFDRVEALIERALHRYPGDAVLEAQARPILALLRSRAAASGASERPDPFDACDLDGLLLIDRGPLRKAIRSLAAGSNPRIIGVSGDARSGKTHSKYFIQHISEKEQKYDTVVVDLSEEAPATFRPDYLIRRIVRGWGRNDLVALIPQRDPTEAEVRWIIDLASFLVGEVRKSQRLLVLVLDGFANDKLHPLTRELLAKLVPMASVDRYLRLIFLHYPRDIAVTEPPGRFETDHIPLFSPREIADFVTAYARSRGETAPPESVAVIIDNVFKTPPPTSNEQIAERLARFLKQVVRT